MNGKKFWLGSSVLVASLLLAACAPDKQKTEESSHSSKTTTSSSTKASATVRIANGQTPDAQVPAAGTIYMRQLYAVPHWDRSFAVVNVTMDGEKSFLPASMNFNTLKNLLNGKAYQIQMQNLVKIFRPNRF